MLFYRIPSIQWEKALNFNFSAHVFSYLGCHMWILIIIMAFGKNKSIYICFGSKRGKALYSAQ